jgi:hypothetical protein
VRAEFAALRKVAHLASEVVRDSSGLVETATLRELRAAIAELHARFPYSVGPLDAIELEPLVRSGAGDVKR